eukprot:2147019-Prymnesium_polylepis.2
MATATDEIVATSVTAVLGTMIPVGNTFQIMGTSATQMHPGRVALACINIEGPPPSPPHPATCDLGVTYLTKSVYEGSANVELKFDTWEVDQAVAISNLRGARLVLENEAAGGEDAQPVLAAAQQEVGSPFKLSSTIARFQLDMVPPAAPGDTEAEERRGKVSFLVTPPHHTRPHVACHRPWSPPPPPTKPPPLPGSPPPPPR